MKNDKTAPMSDSKGAAIDEIIDEIFDNCGDWSGEPEQYYFDEETAKKKLKKLLAQEVKRVIGEDEQQQHSGGISSPEYVHYRNGLRAEQRKLARKAGLV